MSGAEEAGQLPAAPVVVTEDVGEAPPQPRAGWVKSVADGRFHEVEDVDAVLAAYPSVYEECKEKDVRKGSIGWPSDES